MAARPADRPGPDACRHPPLHRTVYRPVAAWTASRTRARESTRLALFVRSRRPSNECPSSEISSCAIRPRDTICGGRARPKAWAGSIREEPDGVD